MTNASVIIMDEPTAALTDREIEACFTTSLINYGEGVSFVSPNGRNFQYIDTILRDGEYVGRDPFGSLSFDGE